LGRRELWVIWVKGGWLYTGGTLGILAPVGVGGGDVLVRSRVICSISATMVDSVVAGTASSSAMILNT